MDVLVTGATGFVGANVTRRLVAEGCRVRVLARPTSSLRALEGCPTQLVRGDILEPDSLRPAVEGCGLVFHVAADYRLWARDPAEIYRNNVEGTRNVLEACARSGVERVVYTSSVGTLGIPKDGGPGTETTPVTLDDMIGPYKRSKFLAERVADEYAARGGRPRGARARDGPPPAGAAHGRAHGAQADVLQRRQGGAGTHPTPDAGGAGAARCRGLVRRSRLRAPASGLPTRRRLSAWAWPSLDRAAPHLARRATRSWASSLSRGAIPWVSSSTARAAMATSSRCASASIAPIF